MTSDPASLDNLRDIVELPPVPWWPLAPGWRFVIALMTLLLVAFGLRRLRRWRASAYRRAALADVAAASTVREVADTLKRTALVAYPRATVAALAGSAWCDWLEATGDAKLPATIRDALTRGVYGPATTANLSETATFASGWIRRHGRVSSRGV